MKRKSFLPKTLAVLLSLILSLPNSALALRQSGVESEPVRDGLENALGSRRQFLRWGLSIATGGTLLALPGDVPQGRISPLASGPTFLDSYFRNLSELSPLGQGEVQRIPVHSSSLGLFLGDINPVVENRRGTLLGTQWQRDLGLAVAADSSTVVLLDQNPMVSRVFLPWMASIAAAAGTRREFLSILLGMELFPEEVASLLEPRSPPGVEIQDYLRETLRRILARGDIQERRLRYENRLAGILEREIFPRLAQTAPEFRRAARGELDALFHPDRLLRPGEDDDGLPLPGFMGFLEIHARASWSGDSGGSWLSSERNYQRMRRYFTAEDGRLLLAATLDLEDRAGMLRLAEWLRRNGREPLSVVSFGKSLDILQLARARTVYREILPAFSVREDALLLPYSHIVVALNVFPHRMARSYFDYVAPADPEDFADRDAMGHFFGPFFGLTSLERQLSIYDLILYNLEHFLAASPSFSGPVVRDYPLPDLPPFFPSRGVPHLRTSEAGWNEFQAYQRLFRAIRGSEREVRRLDPEGFTRWTQEWARANAPGFSTETDYYRGVVWRLVGAGILRPWPEGFWARPAVPAAEQLRRNIAALSHSNPHIRRTAAFSLRRLGATAGEAAPALERAIRAETVPAVRNSMRVALAVLTAAGTEEEIVVDEKIVLERLAKQIGKRLNELWQSESSPPVIKDLAFVGSALYLSDEKNHLAVRAISNPALVGDVDLVVLVDPAPGKDLSGGDQRLFLREKLQQQIPGLIDQLLSPYGVRFNRIVEVWIETDSLERALHKQTQIIIETHSMTPWGSAAVLQESWGSPEGPVPANPIRAAKTYLKTEQLLGDSALYREYRERLITAVDLQAESVAILEDALRKARKPFLLKRLQEADAPAVAERRLLEKLAGPNPAAGAEEWRTKLKRFLIALPPIIEEVVNEKKKVSETLRIHRSDLKAASVSVGRLRSILYPRQVAHRERTDNPHYWADIRLRILGNLAGVILEIQESGKALSPDNIIFRHNMNLQEYGMTQPATVLLGKAMAKEDRDVLAHLIRLFHIPLSGQKKPNVTTGAEDRERRFDGLTDAVSGEVADGLLLEALKPGHRQIVVPSAGTEEISRIFRMPGMQLQAGVEETVGEQNIQDIPENPAGRRAFWEEWDLRSGDVVLLDVPAGEEPAWLPAELPRGVAVLNLPRGQAAGLELSELASMVEAALRRGGILPRVEEVLQGGAEQRVLDLGT